MKFVSIIFLKDTADIFCDKINPFCTHDIQKGHTYLNKPSALSRFYNGFAKVTCNFSVELSNPKLKMCIEFSLDTRQPLVMSLLLKPMSHQS